MRTSGKVLKDFENLRKALFDEEISHMAFMRDGKVEILYTQKYVDKLEDQLQQKENIIKEVRESAKRELKIAEENIKNSEQWLDVEEEQEQAKRDIHTGKVVKRYMEMFLEILDKVD